MPACGPDECSDSKSRTVTLADAEWLASPASPEILRFLKVSPCAAPQQPDVRGEVRPHTSSQVGDFLPRHAISEASDDRVICDASGPRVTNAFQHLMERTKAAKSLTKEPSSSNAALHNSSVRNLERVKEKACGKRQRQPSLDQFLPSHDLIGVWVPARASKRANSKAGAITSPILSICVDRATIHCQHLSPSPPREQPQFTQRGQDHFSLTLSLGSSTEDDCYVDHDQEQQPQDLRDVQSVDQQHELVPWQQPPCQQTPPGKCFVEYTQPVQAFPDPDVTSKAVICRTGFELDRLRVDAGLSSLLSSSSSTVNATVASPASSSLLSCCSAFSPIPSCHSMVDGTAIARNSPSCSDQHPASRSTQSEFSSLQFTDAATPLPHVAPGQVVLESIVVPGTLSDSALFQPSQQRAHSKACSPAAPKFHKQLKVTAETLLPDESLSSSRFTY